MIGRTVTTVVTVASSLLVLSAGIGHAQDLAQGKEFSLESAHISGTGWTQGLARPQEETGLNYLYPIDEQLWTRNGAFQLVNTKFKQCATAVGDEVQGRDCALFDPMQVWEFDPANNGILVRNGDRCVADNGYTEQLVLRPCDPNQEAQMWRYKEST